VCVVLTHRIHLRTYAFLSIYLHCEQGSITGSTLSVVVPVTDDNAAEAAETLVFGLSNADGVLIASNDEHTLTIQADDADGVPSPTPIVANPVIHAFEIPAAGNEGSLLTFFANATDLSADVLTYIWMFGDGSSAVGMSVTHVYADNLPAEAAYTVSVTVDDEHGGQVRGGGGECCC